jgi:hypothetical protein
MTEYKKSGFNATNKRDISEKTKILLFNEKPVGSARTLLSIKY